MLNTGINISMQRIFFLDGFRGLAITLVILFHAFSRWADYLPYGDTYGRFPIFAFGWTGVYLFFLISGFVILMTLEKCDSFGDFLRRRWLRLFPAMLMATVFIFICSNVLTAPPRGIPNLRDSLPGLLFIEPIWFEKIFSVPFRALDGTFWTLFAEVQFYLVFGGMYFCFKKRIAIALIVLLYCISMVFSWMDRAQIGGDSAHVFHTLFLRIGAGNFGWFSAGALMYLYAKEKRFFYFSLSLLLAFFSSVSTGMFSSSFDFFMSTAYCFLIFVVFALPFLVPLVQRLFENSVLVYLGYVSYPLYLIHQNAMLSMIKMLHSAFDFLPGWFLPVPPLIFLLLFADLISRFGERFIKKYLHKAISLCRGRISV